MKIFVIYLIFIALNSVKAFETHSSLTHYIVPPAAKIDWSDDKSLVKSYLKSFMAATYYGYKNSNRKAIGHVVSKIKCNNTERFTSISINSLNMFPSIVKSGISGLFTPKTGAYIQSENEIKKFLFENKQNLNFMKYSITASECQDLLTLDNELRRLVLKEKYLFGPLITNIYSGGTGASYAVAMLENLGLVTHYYRSSWQQRFAHKHHIFKFYDSMKMWTFIKDNHGENILIDESLKFNTNQFNVNGVILRP